MPEKMKPALTIPVARRPQAAPPPPAPAKPAAETVAVGRAVAQSFSEHTKAVTDSHERLVNAIIAALRQVQAPSITVSPPEETEPSPPTWVFEVQRDAKGLLHRIIARPE